MANTVQLKKDGQIVYPVTDVSLIIGLQDAIKLPPIKTTTLPTASAETAGKMYYVGPDANDEYERYITSAVNGSYEWIDLGGTEIPLPSIADNLTTDDANTALSAKQGKVLNEEIKGLEAKVDALEDGYIAPSYTLINGGINTNGSVGSGTTYKHTTTIPVKKGQKVKVSTAGYNFALISKDENGTYTPQMNVTSGDANVPATYIWTAPNDMNISVSVKSTIAFSIGIETDYLQRIDSLEEKTEATELAVFGGDKVYSGSFPMTAGQTNQYSSGSYCNIDIPVGTYRFAIDTEFLSGSAQVYVNMGGTNVQIGTVSQVNGNNITVDPAGRTVYIWANASMSLKTGSCAFSFTKQVTGLDERVDTMESQIGPADAAINERYEPNNSDWVSNANSGLITSIESVGREAKQVSRLINVTAGTGVPASALNDIILEPGVYEFVLRNVTTQNSGKYTMYGAQTGVRGTIGKPTAILVKAEGTKNFWVGDSAAAITTSGIMEAVITKKTDGLAFKNDNAIAAVANKPGGVLFGDFIYGEGGSSTYMVYRRVSNITRIYFENEVVLQTKSTAFQFYLQGYDSKDGGTNIIPYTNWVRRFKVPAGTYVRICIEKEAHTDSTTYVPMDEMTSAIQILEGIAPATTDIIPPNYTYENYLSLSSHTVTQGSCVYDNYFVGANAANSSGELSLEIYDLLNKSYIGQVVVGGVATNTHANSISFSGQKYDEGDIFPLLYIPTGYVQGSTTISNVYVVRLAGSLENLSAEIIQTIHLNFGVWTEFFCDSAKNQAWIKTGNDASTRFRCYAIPSISESEATISEGSSAIANFTLSPLYFGNGVTNANHQQCTYNKGRIWYVSGNPNTNGEDGTYICAINVRNQCRESVVWLIDVGLTSGTSAAYEPESCFIWQGQLFIAFPSFIAKIKKEELV